MKDEIKDYVFSCLPEDSKKWIVVAWDRVVNNRTGSYEQVVVFRLFSEKDSPEDIWNLSDPKNLHYLHVDLGSLRVLSPGTIVQNQRIIQFAHEYKTKREVKIDDPQSLSKKPLRVLYAPTMPGLERQNYTGSVERNECRVLELPDVKILFPCNVIADYYYYGTTYLVKAVLEGKLNDRFKNGNDVYNPKTLFRAISSNGKAIVRVELQRRMSYADTFKIARLAHDYDFRSKCLDVYASILRGKNLESYVDTDFPVTGPVTLSVYGDEVINQRERVFLVHSISSCTAKPPFDLIIAGKEFKGREYLQDIDFCERSDGSGSAPVGITIEKRNKKSRTKIKLNKTNQKGIGVDKALWNAGLEHIPYDRDQSDNFPKDATIKERDFADPWKQEELAAILRKFGVASGLTTNPDRRGSSSNLQINFFAKGPLKPKPARQTLAFENIEDLSKAIEVSLGSRFSVNSQIRCPVSVGIDKYSAFPTGEWMNGQHPKHRQLLNFCFVNVREQGHVQHRRIYINELNVQGQFFYMMDVEPKYKVLNERKELERLVSSSAVIFHTHISQLNDVDLRFILNEIVTTYQQPLGRWGFLEKRFGFEFLRIQHRNDQRSFDGVSKFIIEHVLK